MYKIKIKGGYGIKISYNKKPKMGVDKSLK